MPDTNTIDSSNIPSHIAIIMDGNSRWAKKHNKNHKEGHRQGVKTFKNTVKHCRKLHIKFLSVYAFSTENWKRSKSETNYLMSLLAHVIKKELIELKTENIKIKIIGDKSTLKPSLKKAIQNIEKETSECTSMQLNIMINYGSRQEMIQATRKLLEENKDINPIDINEPLFEKYLYTHCIPDPDILIRTSGENRISNFLLWQISYTELFFIDTLWPDFNQDDLTNIIIKYQNRHRRFGGR